MTEDQPMRKRGDPMFVPPDPVTRQHDARILRDEQRRMMSGTFTCSVCGKPYATATERDACEAEDKRANILTGGPTSRRTVGRAPSSSRPLMVAPTMTDDAVRINTAMARFHTVARSHRTQTFLELLRELFDAANGLKSHAYDLAHGRDPTLSAEAWRNWIRRLEVGGVLVPRLPDR